MRTTLRFPSTTLEILDSSCATMLSVLDAIPAPDVSCE